jgi:uncharacterized protein YjbJ (UPF0337 family)
MFSKMPRMTLLTIALSLGVFAVHAAEEKSMKESAKETWNDTKRGTKKTVREVQDKTCEMINGKMECAAKKVKHSIQNGADKVEDAVE